MRAVGRAAARPDRHHAHGPCPGSDPGHRGQPLPRARRCFWPRRRRSICCPTSGAGGPSCEIVDHTGCTRPDRLRAWLWVGSELGELSQRGERVRRARAPVTGPGRRRPAADSPLPLDARVPGRSLRVARPAVAFRTSVKGDLISLATRTTSRGYPWPPLHSWPRSFATRWPRCIRRTFSMSGCGTGVYTRVVLDADAHVQSRASTLPRM